VKYLKENLNRWYSQNYIQHFFICIYIVQVKAGIKHKKKQKMFVEDKNEKKEQAKSVKPVKESYLYYSFLITYILLLTTASITVIEALRTKVPTIRHIFNMETVISVVASYFYALFIAKFDEYDKNNTPIKWDDITKLRYIDWSITTPFMLLALCVVLSFNIKKTVNLVLISSIIFLNYVMLYLGYLGETGAITRITGMIGGFIAFFMMFFIIFLNFVKPKYLLINYILFGIYFSVWSIYGIVYMFDDYTKNTITSILDCISKCIMGILLWVYYTKLVVV